jgi:hypothetical protein
MDERLAPLLQIRALVLKYSTQTVKLQGFRLKSPFVTTPEA